MYKIKWSATDPDGDALTFTLSYSPNGGQTWTLIASGMTEMSYSWDTSLVKVGDNYLLKVGASDEELTATDQSDAPFSIEQKTETSAGVGFVPSFGIVEGICAIFILTWLMRRERQGIG